MSSSFFVRQIPTGAGHFHLYVTKQRKIRTTLKVSIETKLFYAIDIYTRAKYQSWISARKFTPHIKSIWCNNLSVGKQTGASLNSKTTETIVPVEGDSLRSDS